VKLFLDTSAFAKRYVAEQGSDKVLAMCQEADRLFISVICFPELTSTLCRLVREKKLARAAYRQMKSDAVADLADVDICQITPEVLGAVVSLLEAHPLRSDGCASCGVRTGLPAGRLCIRRPAAACRRAQGGPEDS
jgi:predicted nucleic acid-binding protein